jgi:DNA-binding HxlR family transcriptional regulator
VRARLVVFPRHHTDIIEKESERQQMSYLADYPEILVVNPIRNAILKSILSRDDASVFGQIKRDVESAAVNPNLIERHMGVLVAHGIVHKQPNYITGSRYFYAIHWSDKAQKAIRVLEAAQE